MRSPRYEVRSLTGYNALGSGVAGEGKLATTWWVADTWRCYYEVPLQVVDSGSGRGRKWKRYRTRGKTTTRRGVAERNCERLNSRTRCMASRMTDEARPYPKSSQLARGERRYRRKVASAKQWQRIIAAKQGPCRVCRDPASNGSVHAHITFHHLVSRAQGGDDCADNIVPLCSDCHGLATLRNPLVLEVLAAHLLDSEYAYIVAKLGESGMELLFGVVRS